jgi:APA family basic amino acid/polyamine antiporter
MDPVRTNSPPLARLGLWDTTSIIIGIIVGVGIYVTPARIFSNTAGPWQALGLWLVGGLLSLIGAFCFAELASTYPRSGGEYVYLSRAYGRGMGFLFGWAQLAVIRPAGSIAVVAFGFAEYWVKLFGTAGDNQALAAWALVPIVVFTGINLLGVYFGKRAQNGLTVLKVLGITGILVAGLLFARRGPAGEPAPATAPAGGLALALVYILWTYAGWQEAAYVAAEVRDRRRNLPLALILGTGAVTVLYLLVNLAYVVGLGFEKAAHSPQVAADVLGLALGEWGAWTMSLLVVISTLGALNGMIFTSSRIFAEMGADHSLFRPLALWNKVRGTPVVSLLVQGALCFIIILVAGLVPAGKKGFDTLVQSTAGVFWLFFLLTGVGLVVLRYREPHVPRPFSVPFYPVTPVLFCLGCAGMLVGSILAAPVESLIGAGVLSVGLPLYLLSKWLGGPRSNEASRGDARSEEGLMDSAKQVTEHCT